MLIILCIIALVVIRLSHWIYYWHNPSCANGKKLPPGSMGLPIIGESLEFISTSHGLSIPPFILKTMARYGSVFKTNLFGQKIIVLADSEASYRVFQKEGEYFTTVFLESFFPVFDQKSALISPGLLHKYFKNLSMQLVGPENLERKVVFDLNESTRRHLSSWANQYGTLDVSIAASNMIFEYFAKKLMSYDEEKSSRKLKQNYNAFVGGLISFPLNIPGTTHHACLKGRENVRKVIKDIIEERKAAKRNVKSDFLDYILEEVEKDDKIMNEALARDFCFGLLFATYETTYATMTLAIKFISQHPKVLAQLTEEHEAIIRNRGSEEGSEITWDEYKSMTFTHMVINEVVRLGNIAPGIFRKVVKDFEMKGKFNFLLNYLVSHISINSLYKYS